jgi:hypothetical protein
MEGAIILDCKETRSGYFENDGKGNFHFHPFPDMAQIAPVNSMVCTDVNLDGIPDIIIAGNEYQASIDPGRYDASYGLLLLGDRKGGFKAVPPVVSGLILDGDIRDLKLIQVNKQQVLLSAVNNDKMKAFEIKK